MKTDTNCGSGHRFPRAIISHSVWLYHRFPLSFRDVEELLAKRGIIVSYETIRQWCRKFGPEYARKLKRRQGRLVTDKLRSYSVAQREVVPSVAHDTGQCANNRDANNRAEVSHQPTRQQERLMRRFKSVGQAQRFLSVHGVVQNLFRLGRGLCQSWPWS